VSAGVVPLTSEPFISVRAGVGLELTWKRTCAEAMTEAFKLPEIDYDQV
jgi:hypothetical protein